MAKVSGKKPKVAAGVRPAAKTAKSAAGKTKALGAGFATSATAPSNYSAKKALDVRNQLLAAISTLLPGTATPKAHFRMLVARWMVENVDGSSNSEYRINLAKLGKPYSIGL